MGTRRHLTMSDDFAIKWKVVDKSLKEILLDTPTVKSMSKDEWHKFLRSVEEDKHGVGRLHKLIQAGGDSKKSQFHDLANSRLGKYVSDKEKPQKKEETDKEKPGTITFEKVKSKTKTGARVKKSSLPWEEFQPAEETKLYDLAADTEAERLNDNDAVEEAEGYAFVSAENLPKVFGEYVQATGPIAFIALRPSDEVLKVMRSGIERTKTEVETKTSKRIFPTLEEAQMRLHNKENCRTETRQVVILNINASKKILPKMSALLALQMQTNPTTELTVAILES